MQTSWVLSEKERERRFNKLKKVAFRNNLSAKDQYGSPGGFQGSRSIIYSLEIVFTREEQLRLESICNYIGRTSVLQFDKFFELDPECILHLTNATYFGGPVDKHFWIRLQILGDLFNAYLIVNLFSRFTHIHEAFDSEILKNIEGIHEIPIHDAHVLISENYLASFCYLESIYLDETDSGLTNGLRNATLSGKYSAMRNLLDILQRLKMVDNHPVLRFDQIYTSPWATCLKDEERYKFLVKLSKLLT